MIRRLHPGVLAALALCLAVPTAAPAAPARAKAKRFVVLYRAGASQAAAHAALRRLNARIVHENRAIGLATVVARPTGFIARVARQRALAGASLDRPIGETTRALASSANGRSRAIEREGVSQLEAGAAQAATAAVPPVPGGEPLSGVQWDMAMLHATPTGSYGVQRGSHEVLVGIMDTGIDGSHPDIAPNFNAALSRNFTHDIPEIDGPCNGPGGSCVDANNTDEDGHGTHVAGTVAAPINGLGMAGVAPDVSLVNIRAGQDSGFFFLGPTVDAMTYAADVGIDVVNMSFFTDPWLYNCPDNPADSPTEQAEQRTIIAATERAIRFARARGVTFVSAEGNENTNLDHITTDDTSPDFPLDAAKHRDVDNSCRTEPTEAPGVIGVSSLGQTRKAYYSNYGLQQTDVSAPGGDRREFFGTPQYNAPANRILAPMPEAIARDGHTDPAGNPTDPLVVRDCENGTCAYYQYLQGTSMASPHAVGVAALIVSTFGRPDPRHGGLTLSPERVQNILYRSATEHACPDPRLFVYPADLPPAFDALCEGGPGHNGFYGNGIVDALNAVMSNDDGDGDGGDD